MDSIHVRETEQRAETDVLVVGGGPAGVCAAVAAAREGCSVTLLEQNGFGGGMATAGMVGPFMTCYDKMGEKMIIRGLFEEIVDRLVERGGAIHPSVVRAGTAYTSWLVEGHDHCTPFDCEIFKKLIDDMLVEAGVKALYHTGFLKPVMDGGRICGVVAHAREGCKPFSAKVVVDCTGDGDVAAAAGAPYEMGDGADGAMQPATMFFRICGVDSKAIEADIEKNKDKFYRKDGVNYRSFHWQVERAKLAGDWDLDRASIGLYRSVKEDEWCVNTSRIMGVDSTSSESLTRGEIEGRKQVEHIMAFIRKYIPGCADAKLMASGSTLGIRESRHIMGKYVLGLDDVLNGVVSDDAILLCSNSVDVHGKFGPRSNEYITVKNGDYYGVPYRCLVPLSVEGLLVAGRCISAESLAAGAVRVMPPCMAMGQAAGIAAAISVQTDTSPEEISVELLRKKLLSRGAYL